MNPEFLNLEDVLTIHECELDRFGGLAGLRDQSLLVSALAQPMATFRGAYLHEDLLSMASAYLFYLVKIHPFLDGNKRTGLIVALTFLAINGIAIPPPSPRFYDWTLAVAEGRLDEEGLATFRSVVNAPE